MSRRCISPLSVTAAVQRRCLLASHADCCLWTDVWPRAELAFPTKQPIRRYVSREEMPDKDAPLGQPYLAGWGYILSRDVAEHLLRRVDRLTRHPQEQPGQGLLLSSPMSVHP